MRWMPLLAPLLFLASQTQAVTLHVSPNGPGPDGLAWDTAFARVADAIDAATGGDDIWIAAGRYNESLSMKNRISMYGGFFGTEATDEFHLRDIAVNETILDATGLNDRVLVGADQTELNGFTITNGDLNTETSTRGGSGLICRRVTMRVRNCNFTQNGRSAGPGIPDPVTGGGIYILDATLEIENCVFLENIGFSGGAIHSTGGSVFVCMNCLFDKNTFIAVSSAGSEEMIKNCTFGLFNISSQGNFDDLAAPDATVINCAVPKGLFGPANITYSLVPNRTGEGNIGGDPLFIDPENGNYRLLPNSPCIDAGTKVDVLTDLDGNPRPIDVVGRGHEGETSYDMGCYEFVLRRADLNSDGFVNGTDLILFQDQWKEEASPNAFP